MMAAELRQLFFDAVQSHFSALLGSRFERPCLEVDQKIDQSKVVYLGQNVALELVLDERDEDVGCFVAKVVDGRPASVWKYNDEGELVRDHLTTLLRRHGGEDVLSLFTRVTGVELEARIPITVGDYARMVQLHGQHIIDDDPGLF